MNRTTPWALGLALAMGTQMACASLTFEQVGDVLWDRDTGLAWRKVVQLGFPTTLAFGGGWQYASDDAFAQLMPASGTYASGSGAALAVNFFDPALDGSTGGWLVFGTNSLGMPVFEGTGYNYTVAGNGDVTLSGRGASTAGSYSASYCTSGSVLAEFCSVRYPRTFLLVSAEAPSPVPLPAAAWLLACGLPLVFVRRKAHQDGRSCSVA